MLTVHSCWHTRAIFYRYIFLLDDVCTPAPGIEPGCTAACLPRSLFASSPDGSVSDQLRRKEGWQLQSQHTRQQEDFAVTGQWLTAQFSDVSFHICHARAACHACDLEIAFHDIIFVLKQYFRLNSQLKRSNSRPHWTLDCWSCQSTCTILQI